MGSALILSQQTGCIWRGGEGGGSVSIRSQGRAALWGGGRGGVRADTRLPLAMGCDTTVAGPVHSPSLPSLS